MKAPHPWLAFAVAHAKTRRNLAKLAGCSHSHIDYYWRNGKPLPPKLAAKVAKAVNIKASQLMEELP